MTNSNYLAPVIEEINLGMIEILCQSIEEYTSETVDFDE